MIEYRKQSVLTVKENAIIGHGVNCLGKMNAGVAKFIRRQYPKVYTEYMELYKHYEHDNIKLLGCAQIVNVNDQNLHVANLFTQYSYGRDNERYSDPDTIYNAFISLGIAIYEDLTYPNTVHIPRIGCGLGGLQWDEDVEPAIEAAILKYPLNIIVCDI